MNKKDTLKRFIEELPYRQVIQVHNSFCSRVHSEKHIYGIDELWIQSQFPTSIDLYKAIKYKGFDPTKSICWIDLDGKYHHTGILDIIDLDAVVEHLINWGDAGYNFACDIEHALLDGLVTWCLDQVSDRYNEVEVRTKLEECDFDFINFQTPHFYLFSIVQRFSLEKVYTSVIVFANHKVCCPYIVNTISKWCFFFFKTIPYPLQ